MSFHESTVNIHSNATTLQENESHRGKKTLNSPLKGQRKLYPQNFKSILLRISLVHLYHVQTRSVSVSKKLRSYPSTNPTLTLTYYQLTVVGLGEG